MDKAIEKIMCEMRKRKDFGSVKFVILFGSKSEGISNKMSDYDFAVYYEGSADKKFKFLIDMNGDGKYDVKIFQDLPLYIKKDVLKGKIIYVKDIGFLKDVAYKVIQEFEMFKKYYYDYIGLKEIK